MRAAALRLLLGRLRVAAPFRAALLRLLLLRLRVAAPFFAATLRLPLFRPDDRELFRRLELLDFLAAAIEKLRVGGFGEGIARFAHNNAAVHRSMAQQTLHQQEQLRQRACLAVADYPQIIFRKACRSFGLMIANSFDVVNFWTSWLRPLKSSVEEGSVRE